MLAAACAIQCQLDQVPDLLAKVALAKEGGDKDAAHQALSVFNAVAQEHIMQVCLYCSAALLTPALAICPYTAICDCCRRYLLQSTLVQPQHKAQHQP